MKAKAAGAKRLFLLVLVLALCVQGALLGALVSRRSELGQLNTQIRSLSADMTNLGLSVKAMKQTDLIRRRALDLGMRQPEEGQIRAIAIPVQYREIPFEDSQDTVVASAR